MYIVHADFPALPLSSYEPAVIQYLLFLVIVNVILSVTKIFMKKFDTNNAMSPSASADQVRPPLHPLLINSRATG